MASAHQPSIHLDLRCGVGATESVDRELDRLDTVVKASELRGLRGIVRTLVTAVADDDSTISLELWAVDRAVHLLARYRSERVTGEPPDLHPGAFALVERCAPRWAAERTVSETVLKAELDRDRLGAMAVRSDDGVSERRGGAAGGRPFPPTSFVFDTTLPQPRNRSRPS